MKFVVILLGLCVYQASGEIHFAKYIYTATSGIQHIPEFSTMLLVDGQPISCYDSVSRREKLCQNWMKDAFDPTHWVKETEISISAEVIYKRNIQIAMTRFNQTEGVHTFQRMYGCQWDDESGTVDGFSQYGYDGENYVMLDLKNQIYVAATSKSLLTKQKWDMNRAFIENDKQYLTHTCIDWLKKYIQDAKNSMMRTVTPEISIIQKDSGAVCHVTGFYPEAVMIVWKRDGVEMQEDVHVEETLPNEDGTFQKRVWLTVSREERKKGLYTCEADFKNGDPIKILLDDGVNLTGIIIGIVIGITVLVGGIVGVGIVMVKKKDYKKAPQSDTSSRSSDEASSAFL